MKPRIPLKDLLRLYNVEKLPVAEIAARFSVTRQGIYHTLWRHKVKARPRTYRREPPKNRSTREELHDLYWNQELSLGQIGEKFGVAGTTIWEEMIRHGVPTRPTGGKYYPGRRNMLAHLKIGEKLLINENPDRKLWLQQSLYRQAKKFGIRIAIRNLDESTFAVTRKPTLSIEDLVQMQKDGRSLRSIATEYKYNYRSLSQMLRRYRCEKKSE
jgi:predicted DNA-binding protein YlxM (UPF0122 family)